MGCIQAKQAPTKRVGQLEEERAIQQLAQQKATASGATDTDPKSPPRDTAVLRKAGAFDKLHEDALRAPELQRDVHVTVGQHSQRLLQGFEQKEAEARAMPQLVKVERAVSTRLMETLAELEANDARAAAEPKLEKTFMEKERERLSTVV